MEYKKSRLAPGSRVWITARHSPGKKQTIDAQLSHLRGYCEFNGLLIAHEFVDRGISGGDSVKRDEFNQLLQLVENNKKPLVDGIICYDSSRLAREFDDATWARVLFKRRGYVLEILIGDDFPDDLSGYMIRGAQDYFNAEQLEIIRQKSRDGLREYLKLKTPDGKYYGFWPMGVPWGFKQVFKELPVIDTMTGKNRVKKCIEPAYDLWPLGVELFELRDKGLTYNQIEAATGWLRKRGTVDVTKNDIIGRMYHVFYGNSIYFGQLRMKEVVIDNYVEAMVSRDLWESVNGIAEKYRRGNWRGWSPKSGKTKEQDALLAGLCYCGLCDSLYYHTITSTRRNRLRYYLCSLKRRMGTKSCDSKHVRADMFEQLVLNHILEQYLDPEFTLELVERVNSLLNETPDMRPDIDRLTKEIADYTRAINNLLKLAETATNIDELSARLLTLQANKEGAETRLKQITERPLPKSVHVSRAEVMGELDDIKRRLLDQEESKQVFWQIINKVVLGPREATIFYRRPLCFYDSYLWDIVGFNQHGYVIELPESMRR